jgi:hypothetical protein
VITSFSANPTNGPSSRQVELKGTVSDTNPAMDTVTFTGQVSASTTPAPDGTFDCFGSAGGLGTVTAVATGFSYATMQKTTSGAVSALITSAAPVITSFNVVQTAPGSWTLSGTVVDEAPCGILVQFGGPWQLMGKGATCDSKGNFSVTFALPTLTSGTVTAQCADVWGLLSNTVYDPIFPTN